MPPVLLDQWRVCFVWTPQGPKDDQFWLNLQSNYDVKCAEDAAGRAIAKIQPWTDTGAQA